MLQLARFGFIGLLTNGFGYILYLTVTFAGIPPKLAMTILYLLGVVMSFAANRRWVFIQAAEQQSALVRYGIIYGVGYALNYSILYVFVDRLHYAHFYVQAFGIVAVAAFVYAACSIYAFPSTSKRKQNP
ncbi:GtrA family protein [Rhizobium leguminosarum]|uniref:GtrA family protein n=1 Tax=Rhizobium leguminosarum TaxID=384 RepID=A0A6P0BCN2_RHILE|nr:GtrA family protein [Rhizobium leguminosarum]MBY5439683.1 GtrA family protein [Rhizobium leguminosarum]NEI37258.1 GtrA family protein [Rhizobium leguminosarum]NEI43825.1 GtrA family protein [Rhizobium leguminosarum]